MKYKLVEKYLYKDKFIFNSVYKWDNLKIIMLYLYFFLNYEIC